MPLRVDRARVGSLRRGRPGLIRETSAGAAPALTRLRAQMDLEALLERPPSLHSDAAGRPTSFSLSAAGLRLIAGLAGPGARTLETGNGVSTLVFALRGSEHTCVTPDAGSVELTRRWCADNGVSLDRVRFELGPSQAVLPRLVADPLDLVLIDGGHGFPIPFLDWVHTAGRLRVGGVVVVDDTQIWTGHVLRRFLLEEPGWELLADLRPRTAAFRRTAGGDPVREWIDQPYVVARDPLAPWRLRAVRAARMAARGDLRRLVERAREHLGPR